MTQNYVNTMSPIRDTLIANGWHYWSSLYHCRGNRHRVFFSFQLRLIPIVLSRRETTTSSGNCRWKASKSRIRVLGVIGEFGLPAAVKPLVVNITNKRAHLSALRTYEIECLSSGSKPEAVITWWKGTHQVKHMARNVSSRPRVRTRRRQRARDTCPRDDEGDSEFFVVRRQSERHEKRAELRADHRGRRQISDVQGGESRGGQQRARGQVALAGVL